MGCERPVVLLRQRCDPSDCHNQWVANKCELLHENAAFGRPVGEMGSNGGERPLATLTFGSLVGRERKLNEKEFDEIATDSFLHARR